MSLRQFISRHVLNVRIFLSRLMFIPHSIPVGERRALREKKRSELIEKYLVRYYLPAVRNMEQSAQAPSDSESIYSIWFQGVENAPELVSSCLRSISRNSNQKLVVFDEDSLFKHISLPDRIIRKYRKGKISKALFSDICRLELLYEYGGYWMDSTCYVTGPVPEEICRQNFFVYLAGSIYSYSFIQSCFIRARRGNFIISAWRKAVIDFCSEESGRLDYFIVHLILKMLVNNEPRVGKLFAQMPQISQEPTHMIWPHLRDEKFDRDIFDKACDEAFFQKTTFKNFSGALPGSFADYIIHN